MTIQLKLSALHFPMQPDDVLLGENQLALLADVQEVVTIGPRSHARNATPISFAGDGKTIALIDMHCGKPSHALGKFEDEISCRGVYFLAPIDQHVQVVVDVIKETDDLLLIRPRTRSGIPKHNNTK